MRVRTHAEDREILREVSDYVSRKGASLLPGDEILATAGNHVNKKELFLNSSVRTFGNILDLSDLHRDSKLLDFGCGLGRVAIPFSGYLSTDGAYLGLDIQESRVLDCRKRFGDFKNFSFAHFNQKNIMYNPNGLEIEAEILAALPIYNADIAYLFSVFTHVLPEDCDLVLKVVNHLVRMGGTVLATFFVMNDDIRSAIEAGHAKRTFKHGYGEVFVDNHKIPHHAVAYPEDLIHSKCRDNGFEVTQVEYGAWSGTQTKPKSNQDIFVLRKISA